MPPRRSDRLKGPCYRRYAGLIERSIQSKRSASQAPTQSEDTRSKRVRRPVVDPDEPSDDEENLKFTTSSTANSNAPGSKDTQNPTSQDPPSNPRNLPITLTATLDPAFKHFPKDLRSALEKAYVAAKQIPAHPLSMKPTPRTEYVIQSGTSTYPPHSSTAPSFEPCTVCQRYPSVEDANVALLEHFEHHVDAGDRPRAHNRTHNNKAGPDYVRIETVVESVNPAFLGFYAIRKGDVGWGFDAAGALAFCRVGEEGGRMVWRADFVVGVRVADEGVGASEKGVSAGWKMDADDVAVIAREGCVLEEGIHI